MPSKAKKDKQWAVILGVSSGFGAATAIELAKSGLNICGIHFDRRSTMPAVRKVQAKIRAAGSRALFFNMNAADAGNREDALKKLKKETKGLRQPVKLLMHSLAFGSLLPFVADKGENEINTKQMDLTLDVMAHSLIYWTQDLIGKNLIGAGGQILSMTSAGSHQVWPNYGAVSAAKAALESHTRQLAVELSNKKISVNCIQAGVTNTAALRKIPGNLKMIETAERVNPSGRLTKPHEVATIISMLVNSSIPWLTGNIIRVDGGEDIAS